MAEQIKIAPGLLGKPVLIEGHAVDLVEDDDPEVGSYLCMVEGQYVTVSVMSLRENPDGERDT